MYKINVVIPMAGHGSRFATAGYTKPKPFIDVGGQTMIARVMENLRLPEARYIFIARKEHLDREESSVKSMLDLGNTEFIGLDEVTEGTVCTALFARRYIANDSPLLIANSDQLVEIEIHDFVRDCLERRLDGSILCFRDEMRNPKWSFARIDAQGLVIEVKEKVPISELATVGIYLFARGKDFVDAAIDMIVRNDRVNNEFYTCPVYNYLIREGRSVGVYTIPRQAMHGLGTPEDLAAFLSKQIAI